MLHGNVGRINRGGPWPSLPGLQQFLHWRPESWEAHGVCLTSPCLAICQDGAVVTVHHRSHHILGTAVGWGQQTAKQIWAATLLRRFRRSAPGCHSTVPRLYRLVPQAPAGWRTQHRVHMFFVKIWGIHGELGNESAICTIALQENDFSLAPLGPLPRPCPAWSAKSLAGYSPHGNETATAYDQWVSCSCVISTHWARSKQKSRARFRKCYGDSYGHFHDAIMDLDKPMMRELQHLH